MNVIPKWFLPVVIVALLWNLLGCAAFLFDFMLTPEDVAKMSTAQQAMYKSRPMWSVAATAIAVLFGASGCVGLILRKRWSLLLLALSLLGVIAQDIYLFGLSGATAQAGMVAYVTQGIVLLAAIGLVYLSRQGTKRQWLT
ncbi:MAG: hypothetical protein ACRESU_06210 [Gammaproteobacteria bacterium]